MRSPTLLRDVTGGFKIGSRLFTLEGPSIVRALTERGDKVFLDLKFHDIPNTVATAVEAATSLGVWMMNVHAAGGLPMMQAAVRGRARDGGARPAPTAVRHCRHGSDEHERCGAGGNRCRVPVLDQVTRLARLTKAAGLDGVVASAQETALIRKPCGQDFAIVTPGIRTSGLTAAKDDQERTMTAPEAIAAGASYIVVGRPIIAAPDPRAAAERIAQSCVNVESKK